MSLRRLGFSTKDQVASEATKADLQEHILRELRVLNDYHASMNDEDDPPQRNEEQDQ